MTTATLPLLALIPAAYVVGSIPFGLMIGLTRGVDPRSAGSGNIGATNVARTSPVLGVITLLLDVLKGIAAVWLATLLSDSRNMGFVAAFAAIFGHAFPVWLRFRGGKGVATGLGSFVLLTPKAVLLAIGVFIAIVLAFRYVSLGSISAAFSLPILASVLGEARGPTQIALLSSGSLLIIFKHHQNIKRLLSGSEPKFGVKRK